MSRLSGPFHKRNYQSWCMREGARSLLAPQGAPHREKLYAAAALIWMSVIRFLRTFPGCKLQMLLTVSKCHRIVPFFTWELRWISVSISFLRISILPPSHLESVGGQQFSMIVHRPLKERRTPERFGAGRYRAISQHWHTIKDISFWWMMGAGFILAKLGVWERFMLAFQRSFPCL